MPSWHYKKQEPPFQYNALSAEMLAAQKACCGRGCYNCPFLEKHQKGSNELRPEHANLQHLRPASTKPVKTIDDAVTDK